MVRLLPWFECGDVRNCCRAQRGKTSRRRIAGEREPCRGARGSLCRPGYPAVTVAAGGSALPLCWIAASLRARGLTREFRRLSSCKPIGLHDAVPAMSLLQSLRPTLPIVVGASLILSLAM